MNSSCGKFITLEGGEGCGKSTQITLLAECLQKAGIRTETLRSPGGTPVAEKLRSILKEPVEKDPLYAETELLLFGACHVQLIRNRIQPLLEQGVWVLCDRFFDSTTVYQGYARGLDLESVERINRFAGNGFTPDLTLLFDVSVETGLHRSSLRGGAEKDRFDSEKKSFHEKIRAGFLTLAERFPERFRVVSAEENVEMTFRKAAEVLEKEYGLDLL